MKRLSFLFAGILFFVNSSCAATQLSDDIGGKTFDSTGNPYIVDQDVVIPKNAQTVVKSGCVFLFKSFTGINVYGSMIVEGTAEKPVVFSSINDANYNHEAGQLPNAFDWNGIYIAEESGDIKFRNFKLMYSVFGIKSGRKDITLQNGYFKQNGQFHFTINDNILYVQDNISYSYNIEPKEEPAKDLEDKETHDKGRKSKQKEKNKKQRRRKIAGVSILGFGVAAGITSLITGLRARHYINEMDDIEAKLATGDASVLEPQWDDAEKKFKILRGVCITSGITCGVSIPASLFLFVKKDKSTMTKKVSLNIEVGNQKMGFGFTRYF